MEIIKPKITLNITQLAQYTGIKKRTLYNMIDEGRFAVPHIKGTDPRRWDAEAIDAWRATQSD